jgi:hypothetical protein
MRPLRAKEVETQANGKVAIKVICGYDGDKEVTVFPEEVKDCFRDKS